MVPDSHTIAYYIKYYVDYLEEDDLPFGYLVDTARNELKLHGADFQNFIKNCLKALLDASAVPITMECKDDLMRFIQDKNYGSSTQEIFTNVLTEWRDKGGEEFTDENYPFSNPWFGRPDYKWIPRMAGQLG